MIKFELLDKKVHYEECEPGWIATLNGNIFPTPAETINYPLSNILCWCEETFEEVCAMDVAADSVIRA